MSSIYGIRHAGRNVTIKDDAILQEKIFPAFCLFKECTCSMAAQNKIAISATRGICCGNDFAIDLTEQVVPVSESGTVQGRVVIAMDLSEAEPFSIRAETTAGEFPELIQDTSPNLTNGIYEEVLCTYEANETEISNIQMVASVMEHKLVTKLSGTLAAGETSITLTNSVITNNRTFEFFTSIYNVNPVSTPIVNDGSITLEFDEQDEDMNVEVRVS